MMKEVGLYEEREVVVPKPVQVEAIQFRADNRQAVIDFIGGNAKIFPCRDGVRWVIRHKQRYELDTIIWRVNKGDIIAKWRQGGAYFTCSKDTFSKIYKPAAEGEENGQGKSRERHSGSD